MRAVAPILAILAGLAGCEGRESDRQPGGDGRPHKAAARILKLDIETSRKSPADGIVVTVDQDQMVIEIHNPFGIGKGVIARPGNRWPAAVVVRAYLQGLESLQIGSDVATFELQVSSSAEHQVSATLRRGTDAKHELSPAEPAWPRVRNAAGDYFELAVPEAIFEGNPASIRLAWIDFFRG
jgi:hypothetical protein